MTAKQVLLLASAFLNLQQEFEPLINDPQVQVDERTKLEFNNLVQSLNLCYSEIALDYMPLLCSEQVLVENNKIYVMDLAHELKDVHSITSLDNNKSFKFVIYPDYIKTNVLGNVNITYSYVPEQISVNDNVNNFAGRLSLKCLALGVAAEYCFLSGLYDDAKIFDARFKNILKIECRKKSNITLPKRRWL